MKKLPVAVPPNPTPRSPPDLATAAESNRTRRGGAGLPISAILATVFTAFYAWALNLRHSQFDTYAFDLGLLAQVTWNNLHGHWFATTIMGVNYVAEHFSPALLLLSPVFLVWPNAEALLFLQAAAVAAAGIGVYEAARTRTGDAPTALLIQLAYHLAPATGWVVLDEFHPISLALPAVTVATAALWAKRFRLAAAIALLALLANEDAAIWVAPFGLLIALHGRRQGVWWGAATAVVATAWLVTYLFVIVPAVRPPTSTGAAPPPDVGAFSWCGADASAVANCLVRDPLATAKRAFTPNDRAALASILAPTGGLGLLGASFLVAWPRWLVLLLGNDPPGYRSHYVALLVPAAYLAVGEATGWLRHDLPTLRRPVAGFVVVGSVVAYALGSPLPGGHEYRAYARSSPDTIAATNRALQLIPSDPAVAVSATSSILPHVALRSQVYLLAPGDQALAEYRIFDRGDPYPTSRDDLKKHLALAVEDPRYQVIFDQSNILLLKRQRSVPDRIVGTSFGGFLRLDGYSIAPGDGVAKIALYWHSERWTPINYHYFVHLDDENNRGFSQNDGELAAGYLPTMQLAGGQDVVDTITVPAPPLSDWSGYHLDLGWYEPPAGARLKLPDGQDHLVAPLAPTRG